MGAVTVAPDDLPFGQVSPWGKARERCAFVCRCRTASNTRSRSEKSGNAKGRSRTYPAVSIPMNSNPRASAARASPFESPMYTTDEKLSTAAQARARAKDTLMISCFETPSCAEASGTPSTSNPANPSLNNAVALQPAVAMETVVLGRLLAC